MKKIYFFLITVCMFISNLFIIAFAEGEESVSKIDANFLMGNFYKIILIVVAIGCVAGLIYSNIKSRKKK